MKTYDEMAKNVFMRRDKYVAERKKRAKRITAAATCAAVIFVSCSAVYAVTTAYKEKNVYQKAAESGIDISSVDTDGNFRYEDFSSLEDEITDDPKINIYNKMLNTVDLIDRLTVVAETSMLGDAKTTLSFDIDISGGLSYQSVTVGEVTVDETYSTGENMVFVDNTEKTVTENYLPVYTIEDTPYIPLAERIVTGEDGIPCYSYRRNITNCPLASYCIVPQELAFSYLKDFEKWQIADESAVYLDRRCVIIEGTPSPYIGEKHSIDGFTMAVDEETGIILSFEGKKNGTVVDYIKIISYNLGSKEAVKQFEWEKYPSYTHNTR